MFDLRVMGVARLLGSEVLFLPLPEPVTATGRFGEGFGRLRSPYNSRFEIDFRLCHRRSLSAFPLTLPLGEPPCTLAFLWFRLRHRHSLRVRFILYEPPLSVHRLLCNLCCKHHRRLVSRREGSLDQEEERSEWVGYLMGEVG